MLTITLTLCSRYNTTEQSSGGERGPHTQGRSTGPFQMRPKALPKRYVSLRSSLQEGRNHLSCVTKCCQSLLILIRPRVVQVRAKW